MFSRRPVRVSLATLSLLAGFAVLTSACKDKKDEPAKEDKKEAPAPAPEPEPEPPKPRFDLSGPTPPETSAVVFSVDGALLPLACFDKDKGELVPGKECKPLVAQGSQVYMESSFGTKELDKIGEPGPSMCGDEGITTPTLSEGASFDWAVWPKSLGPEFAQIDPDTWTAGGAHLEEVEEKAALDAINKIRNVKGDFQSKQKASVDVDGDGKDELFISAVLINPADPDSYLFSGLFMAPGGDLGQLQLIDRVTKGTDTITLRGAVDLDGDGKRELWTGISFDGGNGDRMVKLGEEPKPLGKWTCGA